MKLSLELLSRTTDREKHIRSLTEDIDLLDTITVAEVMRWPGTVRPGQCDDDDFVSGIDIMPTFLEAAGVETDERGFIKVDAHMATNVPGVYALGDVAGRQLLAHKASHEGVMCVEKIAGIEGLHPIDVTKIPGCTYCNPQVASVGLTEAVAKEKGHTVKVGKFPMMANSRAKTNHEPDGFVKVIADAETDKVLGVWAIASVAGTMIAAILVMSVFDIGIDQMSLASLIIALGVIGAPPSLLKGLAVPLTW